MHIEHHLLMKRPRYVRTEEPEKNPYSQGNKVYNKLIKVGMTTQDKHLNIFGHYCGLQRTINSKLTKSPKTLM